MADFGDSPRQRALGARTRPVRRALAGLVVIAVIVGSAIFGVAWWEERPLAEAERLLRKGEPREALVIVNRFLRDRPAYGRAYAIKAHALVDLGEAAGARELFDNYGANNPSEFHAWARAFLQQRMWSRAAPLLEYVYDAGVDRADVLHELAACRAKLGDFDGAVVAAEEFAKQPGFEARGNLLLGTIHRERGNLQRAADAWSAALQVDPTAEGLQVAPSEFFLEYGTVLALLGKAEEAVQFIQQSLDLKPTRQAEVALGDVLSQLGKVEPAEAAYRKAIEFDSLDTSARTGLAELSLSSGNAADVVEWLRPLEGDPSLPSRAAFLLQRAHARLGNRDDADRWRHKTDELRERERIQDAADQVVKNSPQSDWARVIRAYRFAESGNWEEARQILGPLAASSEEQPFVKSLIEAVNSRGALPPLDGMPLKQF